jgi:hypothetical protein
MEETLTGKFRGQIRDLEIEHGRKASELESALATTENRNTATLKELNDNHQQVVIDLTTAHAKALNILKEEQVRVKLVLELYQQCPQGDKECIVDLHKLVGANGGVEFPQNYHFNPKLMPLMEKALRGNVNHSLKTLKLYGTYIHENGGVKHVSEGLKDNKTIQNLDLGWTTIGNAEVDAIANMLKTNKSLKELSLYYTDITDVGAGNLLKALRENPERKLNKLDLRSTNVTEGKKQELRIALGITVL